MRQTDPSIKSVWAAFMKLETIGLHKAYSGVIPSGSRLFLLNYMLTLDILTTI